MCTPPPGQDLGPTNVSAIIPEAKLKPARCDDGVVVGALGEDYDVPKFGGLGEHDVAILRPDHDVLEECAIERQLAGTVGSDEVVNAAGREIGGRLLMRVAGQRPAKRRDVGGVASNVMPPFWLPRN